MTEYELRRAHACYIEYDADPKHRMPPWDSPAMVRVYFNCYGDPIPAEPIRGAFSVWIAKEAPGAEKYHPDYECVMREGPSKHPGMLIDYRTIRMFLAGCCPPQLLEQEF